MATKQNKQAIDKFELVTNKVLSLLESGVKPWDRPHQKLNKEKTRQTHVKHGKIK